MSSSLLIIRVEFLLTMYMFFTLLELLDVSRSPIVDACLDEMHRYTKLLSCTNVLLVKFHNYE